MLTRQEFETLEVGDQIETHGLFPKLSPEPVVLRLDGRTIHQLDFVATYFGVTLGRWKCTDNAGELKWQF